jgi:hypothetical protein
VIPISHRIDPDHVRVCIAARLSLSLAKIARPLVCWRAIICAVPPRAPNHSAPTFPRERSTASLRVAQIVTTASSHANAIRVEQRLTPC